MIAFSGLQLECPLRGSIVVTDLYGSPRPYSAWGLDFKHEGIDIAPMFEGRDARVVAAYDGFIDGIGYDKKFMGHYVVMAHEYNGVRFATRYHHLTVATAIHGVHIRKGMEIGRVGDTGYATGVHLHFTMMQFRAGKLFPIDPLPYMPQYVIDMVRANG